MVLLISAIPLSLETWVHLHYMAAVVVSLTALLFHLLWRARKLRWNQRPAGMILSGFLLCALFPIAILGNAWSALHEKTDPSPFSVARSRITHDLLSREGSHVVFVRYAPSHDVEDEWVYNSADIDRQRLIWARDLGEERRYGIDPLLPRPALLDSGCRSGPAAGGAGSRAGEPALAGLSSREQSRLDSRRADVVVGPARLKQDPEIMLGLWFVSRALEDLDHEPTCL